MITEIAITSTGIDIASTVESEGFTAIAIISAPIIIPGARKNIRSIMLQKF